MASIDKERNHFDFKLQSVFTPSGDQPQAITQLNANIEAGSRFQTLLGVTGSGKTFTIANVIAKQNRPTLVVAPNKTLAAQLYSEFREFFPNNRVRYFVSYYDYYQPEAYIPSSDTYIEKDALINEEIDKMRHSATKALLEASDTIIVASVSCIYGLGSPEDYFNMMIFLELAEKVNQREVISRLVTMQYQRTEIEFTRGRFRVRGDSLDIFPSDQEELAIRIVFFGDEIEELYEIDPLSGTKIRAVRGVSIYPVSHYVTARQAVEKAIKLISQELKEQLPLLRAQGKALEAERLERRTRYDLELLQEIGFCPGIENYSRHLAGREEGETPTTLIDYFPKDFLLVIDESHVTLPQIGAMYRGDRSRKTTLVEYGFRLPSALDNRPLKGEEFWDKVGQTIFVSATPAEKELQMSEGRVIEQVNRPTGLVDPKIEIRPAINQVDDLIGEIKKNVAEGGRILALTLTKRMAEELAEYLRELGISCRYLHSDIETIERVEILKGLRRGDFDVLIGINLLREGLDLVEVSLVAILDADKEGFLRSTRSLIQTVGRAARNIKGRAILYADKITDSIKSAISETERRRKIQLEFNRLNNITPRSALSRAAELPIDIAGFSDEILKDNQVRQFITPPDQKSCRRLIDQLTKQMFEAASTRNYEEAARCRDQIKFLKKALLQYGEINGE
jgi:excinuclease ABC subunit B